MADEAEKVKESAEKGVDNVNSASSVAAEAGVKLSHEGFPSREESAVGHSASGQAEYGQSERGQISTGSGSSNTGAEAGARVDNASNTTDASLTAERTLPVLNLQVGSERSTARPVQSAQTQTASAERIASTLGDRSSALKSTDLQAATLAAAKPMPDLQSMTNAQSSAISELSKSPDNQNQFRASRIDINEATAKDLAAASRSFTVKDFDASAANSGANKDVFANATKEPGKEFGSKDLNANPVSAFSKEQFSSKDLGAVSAPTKEQFAGKELDSHTKEQFAAKEISSNTFNATKEFTTAESKEFNGKDLSATSSLKDFTKEQDAKFGDKNPGAFTKEMLPSSNEKNPGSALTAMPNDASKNASAQRMEAQTQTTKTPAEGMDATRAHNDAPRATEVPSRPAPEAKQGSSEPRSNNENRGTESVNHRAAEQKVVPENSSVRPQSEQVKTNNEFKGAAGSETVLNANYAARVAKGNDAVNEARDQRVQSLDLQKSTDAGKIISQNSALNADKSAFTAPAGVNETHAAQNLPKTDSRTAVDQLQLFEQRNKEKNDSQSKSNELSNTNAIAASAAVAAQEASAAARVAGERISAQQASKIDNGSLNMNRASSAALSISDGNIQSLKSNSVDKAGSATQFSAEKIGSIAAAEAANARALNGKNSEAGKAGEPGAVKGQLESASANAAINNRATEAGLRSSEIKSAEGRQADVLQGKFVGTQVQPTIEGHPNFVQLDSDGEFESEDGEDGIKTKKLAGEKHYLTGIEISIAALLSMAGAAKLRAEKDQNTEITDAQHDGKSEDNGKTVLLRRTHMVSEGDTLLSLADEFYSNRNAAWLIADININNVNEAFIDGKRVIELKARQIIELPEPSEVSQFSMNLRKDFNVENLITVVSETVIDRELLQNFLGTISGDTAVKTPAASVRTRPTTTKAPAIKQSALPTLVIDGLDGLAGLAGLEEVSAEDKFPPTGGLGAVITDLAGVIRAGFKRPARNLGVVGS